MMNPARDITIVTDRHETFVEFFRRAGTDCIEAIFKFETKLGRGDGIIRLIPDTDDGNRLKAWTLLTALEELKGFEELNKRMKKEWEKVKDMIDVPEKFADPEKSGLTFTVKPGETLDLGDILIEKPNT